MNDYEVMLNLTFEIEGLIMLLRQRDDEMTNEIKKLLVQKVSQLNDALVSDASSGVSESKDITDTELAEISEMPEITVEPSEKSISAEKDAETENNGLDAEMTEIEEMPEATVASTETPISQNNTEPGIHSPHVHQKGLPTFTLNDKFRFRRELFANNEADFNETLNVLSAMSSLSEAEDYLYNDLCWEPSDENVADFMAVLTEYFK